MNYFVLGAKVGIGRQKMPVRRFYFLGVSFKPIFVCKDETREMLNQ